METLSPAAQPLPQTSASQQAPENAHHSSEPSVAGSKPHLLYKCLLNQYAQKLRKPPPVYQTQNEGSEHQPRFRTTVWLDGVSYTSSSTFQQRKMSEMDASKLAYISITQKAKTDSLHFIQQDKIFCKSILADFAAKRNIGKPVYETTQLEASVPVFRSYLHFNGGTYPGDSGKSKKEAEQLVARSFIIQYLDSELGTDMADVVYCKLRQHHEMNKVQEINSIQSGHTFALTESGTSTMAKSSAAPESSLVQGTTVSATLSSGVPQPIIPQLLIETITPAAPVVTQPPAQEGSTEPVNLTIPHVTRPPTPQVSTESTHSDAPVVTQQPGPQVSVEPMKAVVESLVLTPVPSAAVNNSCTLVVAATSNIIPQPKPEALPSQALEYIPLVDEASGKKRRRKNKKNAQKKKCSYAQMPVIPATSQVLPFSSQ